MASGLVAKPYDQVIAEWNSQHPDRPLSRREALRHLAFLGIVGLPVSAPTADCEQSRLPAKDRPPATEPYLRRSGWGVGGRRGLTASLPTRRLNPAGVPFSVTPEVVLKGANIAVKPAYYSWGGRDSSFVWAALWDEWDWDNWIKFQIDAAKVLGANTIRMIGDVAGIYSGMFTRVEYLTRLEQVLNYLAIQNMYMYYCGGDLRNSAGAGGDVHLAEFVAAATTLRNHPNLIAWDVVNEISASYRSLGRRQCIVWAREWTAGIRAVAPNIPLGFSNCSPMFSDVSTYRKFDEFVDYFDLHLYPTPSAPVTDQILDPLLGMTNKPILIGEFGSYPNADGPTAASSYNTVREMILKHQQIMGGYVWDICSSNFGLFDYSNRAPEPYRAITYALFPTSR